SVIQSSCSQKQLPKKTSTINRTYLMTFFAFSMAIIYGTIGLHLEAGQPLAFSSLRQSPFIFWRQFFLRPLWLSLDIIWCTGIPSILTIVLDFALKGSIAEKYLFTFKEDKKGMKLG